MSILCSTSQAVVSIMTVSVCNLRTQKCEHLLARKASPVLPQSIAAVVLLQVVVVINLLTIAISFLGQISKTSPGRDTLR